MKTKSFGNKLLVKVLGATIVVFAITMFFVSKSSFETASNDAQEYVKELSGKYASKIQGIVDQAVIETESYASLHQASLKHEKKLEVEVIIEKMSDSIRNIPSLIGIWFTTTNPEYLYEKKIDSDKIYYDKNGNFSPYVVQKGDDAAINEGGIYNENDAWIKGPKEDKKTHITKPYKYPVNGTEVLMASIASPLYKDNNFLGAIGVDISMAEISELINNIKIYESGYSFIVDHNGMIVGHANEEYWAKDLLEIVKSHPEYVTALNNSKNSKEHTYFIESIVTGKESIYYSYPFKIKGANVNWTFFSVVPTDEYLAEAMWLRNFSIIASIAGLVIIALIIFLSVRVLKTNLESISEGLDSFYKFLNKETSSADQIELKSNDEFGAMAKSINENVEKVQKSIQEDNSLIDEVKTILQKVKEGYLDVNIYGTTSTESLNELKNLLNEMLANLRANIGKDINVVLNVLSEYGKLDFRNNISNAEGKVELAINDLTSIINSMLKENKENGLTLDESSNILLENVDTLNRNSTETAAALEETAAALEEITSTIVSNTESISKMSSYAKDVSNSVETGKELAMSTVKSMDEINEQTQAIADAITVIDQIAFQTNILSLNAAVEAATAGEAGKGFAVVAQEVRNLASRSAEAAKEIKDLVENATSKTNIGKEGADKMIEGYHLLNESIDKTTEIITHISDAAQEQKTGIEQINDAVNQLDKQTQENVAISNTTHDVAEQTDAIAKLVVSSANEKEFIGKDSVIAKDLSFRSNSNFQLKKKENSRLEQKSVAAKSITSKLDNEGEWENF